MNALRACLAGARKDRAGHRTAMGVLEHMKDAGITPNIKAFTMAIQVC